MTPKKYGTYSKMNEEKWLLYGLERKFDTLSAHQVSLKEPGYYKIGLKNKWIYDLFPGNIDRKGKGFYSGMTKEKFLEFAEEHNVKQYTKTELSKIHRGFYARGLQQGWLDELKLKYAKTGHK
jgi:hypothetical protein